MSVSGTGVYDITLKDTVADALSIVGGTTDMIVFCTDTDSITITPPLTVTGLITSNGGIKVGASGAGFDVIFYGDTATADFFWDQNGDANGSLTLGVDATGNDFRVYGDTTGNYLHWDQSADDLLLVGTATQFGVAGTTASTDSTTGSIHTAGGLGVAGAAYIAGVVEVGANAAGTDFTVYGDVASYKTWWDANGDTNGAWYFGADTKGVLVSLYGDTTGCGVFWNPSTDTNGTFSFGATGGSKGVDVVMYGHTNGSYLKWDRSADALLVVASSITFSGATTGITMPGDVDYTPLIIGTKASSATGGFNVAGSGDDSGGVQIYADDGGADATGEVLTPLRVRYLLSVNQSGGVSHTALFSQLVSNGTRTYTTGAVRAAYIFLQLGATTLATSGELLGINQATTLVGNVVVGTGCTFAGIDINIATGSYTIDSGGTNAALLVRSSGTGLWRNGLEIATSGATTGIKIGTCVTGISMTGAYSTAAFAVSTTLAAYDDHVISSVSTCAATSGEQVANEFTHTMTGAGALGFAAKVLLDVNERAGSYVTALYGFIDLAGGSVSGLGSAVCAEMLMGAAMNATGTYGVLEIELGIPASWTAVQSLSLIYAQVYGGDATALGLFNHSAYVLNLVGLGAAAASHIFHTVADPTATHGLRILIDGVGYDIMLKATGN
jgi:hypothetical protein